MWDQNKEKLGVTGHRGCAGYMPENTLISFREAFKLGVDVVEFDVHTTIDGHLVVIHDNMVNRTTNGIGAINFKTLEEIKTLDAGVRFGYPGQRVPTLNETLDCVKNEAKGNLHLNVEIKDYLPYVVDKTIEALKAYGLAERSVIASFDAQTLLYTQDKYPDMKTQGQPPRFMNNFEERVLDKMYGMGVPMSLSDDEIRYIVSLADDHGIQAWGWHADNREAAERALKFGFTNITANNPNDLIKYLDEINRRI